MAATPTTGEISGHEARVYYEGIDISGDVNNVQSGGGRRLLPTAALGSSSETFIQGRLNPATSSITAYWDSVAETNVWTSLQGSTNGVYTHVPKDEAAQYAFSHHGQFEASAMLTPVEGTVGLTGSFRANDAKHGYGKVLLPKTVITETGTQTSVDMGAASTYGYTCFLHVFAIGTTVTVDVEESSDDAVGDAFESYDTFTQAAAIGAERITASTAGERYLQINVTELTGGDATIAVYAAKNIE